MSEAQPFYVNSPYGIALCHNGNLTNAASLREYLDKSAHRHINTDSDSEILLNILADELQSTGKRRIDKDDVFEAVKSVFVKCLGGYACVAMIAGFGIVAFRDPHGIRPCVYGKRKNDFIVASESVAIEALNFQSFEDLKPGEALIFTKEMEFFKKQLFKTEIFSPCIFEYVYFARQDSIIDKVPVYDARLAMGRALAEKILKDLPNNDIDVVIPVPDTARCSALELSFVLKKPFREGFNKNRYIGRTFIMPGQQIRAKSVVRKLNAMSLEFKNKNVLLVDDSIVRGTTSKEIVTMARNAGAKKVYFASCAPPIRHVNVYGIDIPTRKELVAHNRTESEIAKLISADHVIFLSIDALEESVRSINPDLKCFESSVFNGKYVTGDVDEEYISYLEKTRDRVKKSCDLLSPEIMGLHNFTE